MPPTTILFYLFVVVVGIQVAYYILFLTVFGLKKHKRIPRKKQPVSVVVCAKNEAQNLLRCLPALAQQDYPLYELVLVNDSSTDDTLDIITQFSKEHPNVKIVNVKANENFWGNKKYALTLGIKASKHDLLLFTDADCKPASKHWIRDMVSHFSKDTEVVLGYGAYMKKKGFLNKLIRYETLLTAMQYFSWAGVGMPYMGVGRNLAYRKETFFNASGFMSHINIRSGDDDLFVNETANKTNTALCLSPESFTSSTVRTSFTSWIRQKRRHISTSRLYKRKHKLVLGLFYLSQLLFWALGITLLSFQVMIEITLVLIALRFLVVWITGFFSAKKLSEKDLVVLYPVWEISLICLQLYIFMRNLVSKPKFWK